MSARTDSGPRKQRMRYSTARSPGVHRGRDERSVALFELSAVGALRILEEDHGLRGVGVADEDAAFGGMARGRLHRIRRCHRRLPDSCRRVAAGTI